MIRTTIRFDENLFKEARKKAIDRRVAFTELVNEALSLYLGKTKLERKKRNSGTDFLRKLIEIGEKYPLKGPKDLAKNHDKYIWDRPDNR